MGHWIFHSNVRAEARRHLKAGLAARTTSCACGPEEPGEGYSPDSLFNSSIFLCISSASAVSIEYLRMSPLR